MNKKIVCEILVGLSIVSLVGCRRRTDSVEPDSTATAEIVEKVSLTDRQIEILKELGLPSEYENLDESQQKEIDTIEELLTGMETKYPDRSFTFREYGVLDAGLTEWVTMYLDDSDTITTAYKKKSDGKYSYEDDAQVFLNNDAYAKEVETELQSIRNDDYKVYVSLTYANSEINDVIEDSAGEVYVFMKNSFESEEELSAFVSQYTDWLKEKSLSYDSSITFVLQSEEDFNNTAEEKMSDIFFNKMYDQIIYASVSVSKVVDIVYQ